MRRYKNGYWSGANSGLYRSEGSGYIRIAHERLPVEQPVGSGVPYSRVNTLLVDASGDLWIGTNRTLLHMHEGEFTPHRSELGSQQVYDIVQTGDGRLYIAARFGVFALTARADPEGSFGLPIDLLYLRRSRTGDCG